MQPTGKIGPANQLSSVRKRETYVSSLSARLRDYMKSLKENYEMILSRSKAWLIFNILDDIFQIENPAILSRNDPYTQASQENFEANVRAANIVCLFAYSSVFF